jgi:hypothetical protein
MTYGPNGIWVATIEVSNELWGWCARHRWSREERIGEEERRKKGVQGYIQGKDASLVDALIQRVG